MHVHPRHTVMPPTHAVYMCGHCTDVYTPAQKGYAPRLQFVARIPDAQASQADPCASETCAGT